MYWKTCSLASSEAMWKVHEIDDVREFLIIGMRDAFLDKNAFRKDSR